MALPTSSSSLPSTNSPTLDPALFREYISTKQTRKHQISLANSPSTPVYTVQKKQSLSRDKPALIFHAGEDKTAPAAGLVKIHHSQGGYFTIGVGNPDATIEEGVDKGERMVWERLQKTHKWRFRRYQFEFGPEGVGQRSVYTWRRTSDRWPNRLRDMELRVGEEETGELVAVWKGSDGLRPKSGSMFVKRRGEEGKWDIMVLLTGMAIIEAFIRR